MRILDYDMFTLTAIIIAIVLFLVIIVVGAIFACCCKARLQELRESLRRGLGRSPCTNCQLIDMGEAVCDKGYCSECGNVPPSLSRQ